MIRTSIGGSGGRTKTKEQRNSTHGGTARVQLPVHRRAPAHGVVGIGEAAEAVAACANRTHSRDAHMHLDPIVAVDATTIRVMYVASGFTFFARLSVKASPAT